MKHKHYDMIVAKAANMGLVVFSKTKNSEKWEESSLVAFIVNEHFDFFLCLPQHKEACLHWLNGGESQYLSNGMEKWINFGNSTRWSDTHLFMTTECELRIKPKKESRWIGVYKNGATTDACLLRKEAENHPMITDFSANDWQFIEIEIEVTN